MTLHAPVDPAGAVTVEAAPFDVPDTAAGAAPRFAGEPVHWLNISPNAQALAICAGARRVFTGLNGGWPGGPTLAALIEITPMPGSNAGLLLALTGGTPVQYVLLDAADLAGVTTPDLQISVAGGTPLLTVGATGAWIGFVRQDRICRDPRAWVDDLEAAAGSDLDGTWTPYASAVRALVQPTARLVDHIGRPATGGTFIINTGSGPDHTVAVTDPGGDTGLVIAGAGHLAAADTPNLILASTTTDAGALGAPIPISPTDRHVATLPLNSWLPPRSAGVTGLHDWTAGNHLEPIPDGLPYFANLVPDLRSAQHGGAVAMAGWAFVKEALADPTKAWTLLPEDDSTQLVQLIGDLKTNNADVRILVNQFVQVSDAGLDALRADAAVAFVLLMLLMLGAHAYDQLQLNPAGWIAAGFLLPAIVELLPNDTLLAAIRSLAEPSKPTVTAINDNNPDVAIWTPYPATLTDNPLADNPLHIAGVPFTALSQIGVYHEKIAAIQPPGQPPIAYLGGIDINSNRLDDPVHRAFAPYHDVQVKLRGPAVSDVLVSLAERAAVAGTTSPLPLAGTADPLPRAGHHIVQVGRTRFAPATAPGHGDPFGTAPQGENTTHQTLLAAIRAARDYIYIEDQYLTPDNDYVETLVAAGNNPDIKALVITVPNYPDQPYGGERRGEVIAALATTWGNRLRVGAPVRRYLNPTPQAFAGLGRMVLRAGPATTDMTTATTTAIYSGDTEAFVGPAERVPATPFWAFIENELVLVESVEPSRSGTGPIGYQDPEQPDSPTQTWQHITIQRSPLGQDQGWGAKPDKHDKNSCVLAVQIPGIYVHAKLMVIDDIFLSVGSSNLNRRGFFHDGEMNAFAVPEHLKATRPTLHGSCAAGCGPNTSGWRPRWACRCWPTRSRR